MSTFCQEPAFILLYFYLFETKYNLCFICTKIQKYPIYEVIKKLFKFSILNEEVKYGIIQEGVKLRDTTYKHNFKGMD